MTHRILLCVVLLSLVGSAQPAENSSERSGENWVWNFGGEDSGGGSSYLGVDIADVTTERLSALKLKEERGVEVTMVDQDAPAGKAGLHEHDVVLTMNGAQVDSAAQLRRMIKETPPARVVSLGISRDGQPLTLKVQLASRGKIGGWPGSPDININIPPMPLVGDFETPVSIVIAHSSMRTGLMVENITPQLGEYFGIKNGNGVLVRMVEKGSRAEKAGFHAGDVVVKVNTQSIKDTSDFTHALRSTAGSAAAVTVMRDRKEQNLTLSLPEKKDSGVLMEDSFDLPAVSAETQMQLSRVEAEMARLAPALQKSAERQSQCWKDVEKAIEKKVQDAEQQMKGVQKKMLEKQQKLQHELSGEWTEI